jgi:hypothetical protein
MDTTTVTGSLEDVLATTANKGSNVLDNNYLRISLMVVVGVLTGYTLQPPPEWLFALLRDSHVFKFVVLFVGACIALHPVNKDKLMWILVACVTALVLFELARKYDADIGKVLGTKK